MSSKVKIPLIDFELIAPSQITASLDASALGLQCIGEKNISIQNGLPIQHIALPLLNSEEDSLFELWRTQANCRDGQFRDIVFRCTDTLIFGVIEIDESRLETNAGESILSACAETAYRQIFSLLESENFPHLWRAWNYVPNIHDEENGLERYRQFNIGRHRAFAACNRAANGSPAASALGTRDGFFSVAFIAGRIEPNRIENPRQVSAFDYPLEYGPCSPTFTRAVTMADDECEALFISGTASIVGHRTVHANDVSAQARETVANLAALLEQANARTRAPFYAWQDLRYRVYIRHPNNYSQVRAILEELTACRARAIYVQADICRQDLLLEIEAFALKPSTSETA